MGFCCVGPTPLSDGLASTVSLSLSLSRLLCSRGPPLLLMSSFRRAMPEPPISRRLYNYYRYTHRHTHARRPVLRNETRRKLTMIR